MRRHAIVICLAVAPLAMARTLADMEPALAKIAQYEYGQNREALIEFDQFVRESTQKLAIEQRLIRLLNSEATFAGKDFGCRQLSIIGTAAAVPVLAGMLQQAETFEMARYALERIPSPAVDEALRKALPKASGKMRAGVIDSLGRRRDTRAVVLLKPLLNSPDAAAAEAAAAALGNIAGAQAAQALGAARPRASGALKIRIAEAYLKCAERLTETGDKPGALRIYKQLSGVDETAMVRIAALGGLATAGGKDAVPALAAGIASGDGKTRATAIRFLNRIPGPEATTALTAAFPKLPPQGQVVALATLADRGDLSARPVVMEAASSEAAEVRAAALVALGKLGDRSALNLLAERAAAGAEGEQAVARESLYRLRGADIDGAIVQAVGSAAGRVRIELIRAAGERGIALATDALIASARDNDRDVRRESLKALKDTAAPNHAQPLLDLVLAAQNSAERREAGRTLATVLKKTEQPPLDGVIAAYRSSNSAPLRALLVDVMGQVASGEVLPVLRSALQDGQREVSRAAILALSDWPTAAPMNDLFAVAKADANAASQVLALRGYIKLVSAPSERPATESARLLNEAMGLARQPEERKSVLALLPRYPCREAMQVAEAAQEDAAVANEAKAAMERIARAIEAKR